jgi:hypothetical protein
VTARSHAVHTAGLLLLLVGAGLRAEPTVVRELHYGEALFMFYQEQHFEAITRIQAGRLAGHIQVHDEQAQLLLGGMLLSWGQHAEAADIFQRLLAASASAEVRDRAWLQLARISYQRGALAQSASALAAIGTALPRQYDAEKRLLEAQVLMRDGQYAQAAGRLDALNGAPAWRAYARYNLGVALLRQDRLAEGVRHLEHVGGLNGSEEISALADRANLALGFMLLQQDDPSAARTVLQRVRLNGPHSNQALLGVGWADSALDRHRESLTPWLALRERDLLDPAVQESLLAIPYAFARLGAHGQAAEFYLQAVESLDGEIARLQDTIGGIRQGGLVPALLAADDSDRRGLHWQLDALPDRFESRYLYQLLATHEFQEGLKNHRDLDFLAGVLREWSDNLGAFADMVVAQQLAWEQRAPGAAELMSASDVAALHSRHEVLQARLAQANAHHDTLALIRDAEPTQLAALDEVSARLAALGNEPELAELQQRERLLRGVLLWQLNTEFPARVWQQRRELRDLQPVLRDMQAREARIRALQDGAAERFDSQGRRIASLGPRVAALSMEVGAARVRQRQHLEAMAVTALETQVARLRSYEQQARFALARIYDRAATEDASTAREGVGR